VHTRKRKRRAGTSRPAKIGCISGAAAPASNANRGVSPPPLRTPPRPNCGLRAARRNEEVCAQWRDRRGCASADVPGLPGPSLSILCTLGTNGWDGSASRTYVSKCGYSMDVGRPCREPRVRRPRELAYVCRRRPNSRSPLRHHGDRDIANNEHGDVVEAFGLISATHRPLKEDSARRLRRAIAP